MQETSHTVRILNNTIGIGEKIARIGNMEGTFFFRKSILTINDDAIRLSCADDIGGIHELGNIPQNQISRIRLKKSVFTPGQQLIKPAMSGALTGVVGAFIAWFKVGGRPGSPIGDSPIISGLCFALFLAVIFVLVNLGKVVWSHLAVVAFDSADGASVEVAIENEKVDVLLAPFVERRIPISAIAAVSVSPK